MNIPFTIYSANDPGIGPTPDWPGTSINIVPRVSDDSGNALVTVQPKRSGKLLLKVRSTSGIVGEMVIDVPKPPINQLVFSKTPSKLYVGTLTQFTVKVFDKAKVLRDDTDYVLKSSDTSIADFDNFGNLKTK